MYVQPSFGICEANEKNLKKLRRTSKNKDKPSALPFMNFRKTNKPNEPLNIKERQVIEKFIHENYSCLKISKIIGRGKNSIVTEIRRNGGKELYNAEEAQHRSDQVQAEKKQKTMEALKKSGFNPYISIKQKIEFLEMQIEILIDAIKKLKEDM